MPFGKHKGVEVKDLEFEYLKWLTTIDVHGVLRQHVTYWYSYKSKNRKRDYKENISSPWGAIREILIIEASATRKIKNIISGVWGE